MPHLTTDDGVKLSYDEVGSGIPIVFVHEFAGNARSWEAQLRYFGRRYRAIAYNARGYPPSDVPAEVGRYSQDARPRRHPRRARRTRISTRPISSACPWAASRPPISASPIPIAPARSSSPAAAMAPSPGKRAQFTAEARSQRRAVRAAEHGRGGRSLCAGAVARAAPEQGPARLARIHRPPRAAFGDRFGDDAARRAEPPALALRPRRGDEADHRADPDHDRRRGLGLPGAGDPHEEARSRPRGWWCCPTAAMRSTWRNPPPSTAMSTSSSTRSSSASGRSAIPAPWRRRSSGVRPFSSTTRFAPAVATGAA